MLTKPEYIKSAVPEGRSRDWVVERIDIPAREYDPSTDPRPECFKFRPGRYTCLRRGHTVFMTDLYDEWWTQREAIEQSCRRGGQVLITGLGLGLVVESIFKTPHCPVQRITVLEYSRDVIKLVGQHLASRYRERLAIIHADAFTWEPPRNTNFSVIWHDIWPNPHAKNTAVEMGRLAGRFQNCCDWQGFWPKSYWEVRGQLPNSETYLTQIAMLSTRIVDPCALISTP